MQNTSSALALRFSFSLVASIVLSEFHYLLIFLALFRCAVCVISVYTARSIIFKPKARTVVVMPIYIIYFGLATTLHDWIEQKCAPSENTYTYRDTEQKQLESSHVYIDIMICSFSVYLFQFGVMRLVNPSNGERLETENDKHKTIARESTALQLFQFFFQPEWTILQ